VYEFARIAGGAPEQADSAAFAIEFIHAFSLIHDDLPCMDDDLLRRGKPSCHAVYGEAIALLAGDALGSLAAEVMAADTRLSDAQKLRAIRIVTRLSGVRGMIGGQVLDMIYGTENNPYAGRALGTPPTATITDIEEMYRLKTGALLSAACQLGFICADGNVSDEKLAQADTYAMNLGLAFQIRDDILDIEGDEAALGKPLGSDIDSGKLTYVCIAGMERAKHYAAELTEIAVTILKSFPNNEQLMEITQKLLNRKA
jgi:geranylgeranyl diphosphate synthase type II